VSRIRIVALLEAAVLTGPAKNVLKFATDCRDRVDMTLVTFERRSTRNGVNHSSNQFVSEARRLNIPVEIVAEAGPFDLTTVDALRGIFHDLGPHIVETHGTKSHFLVSLLGRQQFRWIAFHHGYTAEDAKAKFYQQFDRWSLRRCDSAVTVCGEFARLLGKRGVPRDRISVVHNAVETGAPDAHAECADEARRQWGVKKDERIVFSAGRLSSEKGHSYLIEAVSKIAPLPQGWNLRTIIAGSGPCEEKLKARVVSLGMTQSVEFVGHRSDLRSLFAVADVFALPSLSEGSPNVLLESMAAGVPIVSSNVGGVSELLENRDSAILVAPADADSLKSAILELLTNRQLAHRLAVTAFEKVRARFSPAERNQRLLEIYTHASKEYGCH
jgi:glycosyltransferase involved in cell wall biosynthesis